MAARCWHVYHEWDLLSLLGSYVVNVVHSRYIALAKGEARPPMVVQQRRPSKALGPINPVELAEGEQQQAAQ